MKKVEIYKWCPKAKAYVLETTTSSVVLGMLKAKSLAVKGIEVSAWEMNFYLELYMLYAS